MEILLFITVALGLLLFAPAVADVARESRRRNRTRTFTRS